jgi:hypothetical protein
MSTTESHDQHHGIFQGTIHHSVALLIDKGENFKLLHKLAAFIYKHTDTRVLYALQIRNIKGNSDEMQQIRYPRNNSQQHIKSDIHCVAIITQL